MRSWQTRITPSREASAHFSSGSKSGPLDQNRSESQTSYERQGQENNTSSKERENPVSATNLSNMNIVSAPLRANFPSWAVERGVAPNDKMNELDAAKSTSTSSVNAYRPISADDEHRIKLENLRLSAREQFGDWLSNPRHSQSVTSIDEVADSSTDTKISPTKLLSFVEENQQKNTRNAVQHALTKSASVNFDQMSIYPSMPSTTRTSIGAFDAQQSVPNSLYSVYANQDVFRTGFEYHSQLPGSSTLDSSQNSYFNPISPISALLESEFSVFVGDLCPDLCEEDLVNQFINPPLWPPSHPFAIAHAHAQQAKGKFGTPPKIGPAPFLSTKSAAIMTDPSTGLSRGFGFVRFTSEIDCARALVEMQGIIIQPASGKGGRPLRVCPATPKNRSASNPTQTSLNSTANVQEKLMNAIINPGENVSIFDQQQQQLDSMGSCRDIFMPTTPYSPAHHFSSPPPASTIPSRHQSKAFGQDYTQLPGAVTSNPLSSPTSGTGATDVNNTTVFVGGLSSLISEETLKTFFAPFGEIKYVKIPPGKGCGFVQFLNKHDAERAIERMQGFPIGGGRIRLSWGRSQSDKAAAAAAQAAVQAAHIGRLAGLAGLSSNETSQFTAVTLAAGGNNTPSESHNELLKQLTAAAISGAQLTQKSTSPQRMPTDAASSSSGIATSTSFPPFTPIKSSFDPFVTNLTNTSPWQKQNNSERQDRSTLQDEDSSAVDTPSVSSSDLLKSFSSLQLQSGDQAWPNRNARALGEFGELDTSRSPSSTFINPDSGSTRQKSHTLAMTPTSWSNAIEYSSGQSFSPFVSHPPKRVDPPTRSEIKRPSNSSYRDSFDSKFNPFGAEDMHTDPIQDQDESIEAHQLKE